MCLELKVRSYCDPSDTEGFFLDDIPAVSELLIMDLKMDDRTSMVDHMKKLTMQTMNKFLTDIESQMAKYKKLHTIVAETKPSRIHEDKKVVDIDIEAHAYHVEMPYHENAFLYIHGLNVFAAKKGKVRVFIKDMGVNKFLYDTEHEVEGYSNIVIEKRIYSTPQTSLVVGLQTITASLVEMACEKYVDKCGCGCPEQFDSWFNYVIFNDRCINSLKESDMCSNNYQKVFCLNASIRCDFKKMICAYKDEFMNAFNHCGGIIVLRDKIAGYTRGFYKEKDKDLVRTEMLPMVTKEYHGILAAAVEKVSGIMNDSICWSCESVRGRLIYGGSYV